LRSSALPSDSPHFIEGAARRDDESFEFVGSGGAERSALGAERSENIAGSLEYNSVGRCRQNRRSKGRRVRVGPSFSCTVGADSLLLIAAKTLD